MKELLEKARKRPGFLQRLRERMEQDKHILDRLKELGG